MKQKIKKNKWWEFGLILVIRDIINFRKWINVIKEEESNPLSKFNKFNLKRNYLFKIYHQINIRAEDSKLPDDVKRLLVFELLAPIHKYIDEELGFAGYISPEFINFYDNENKPTGAYGVVYNFEFEKLSITWIIKYLLVIGISLFLLFKFI